MTLPAISIRQPWAALIVLGIKDIENRTWPLPGRYVGKRVSIHAGQQPDRDVLEYPRQPIREAALRLATFCGVDDHEFERLADAHPEAFELGGIVGQATMRGCTLNGSVSPWASPIPETWHWQIAAASPGVFVRCKGALGFFDLAKEAAPAEPQVGPSKQASLI